MSKQKYPKIIFRYSSMHDEAMRAQTKLAGLLQRRKLFYPSSNVIQKKMNNFELTWRKVENNFFVLLEKLTNFQWKEKEIICYVRGRGIAISDPLTLSIVSKNANKVLSDLNDRLIIMLTHEIIHRLFENNRKKADKLISKIQNMFRKKMHFTILDHVLIFALEKEITDRLKLQYPQDRLDNMAKNRQEYAVALNILRELGQEAVLKLF